jgi:hypothetical protein
MFVPSSSPERDLLELSCDSRGFVESLSDVRTAGSRRSALTSRFADMLLLEFICIFCDYDLFQTVSKLSCKDRDETRSIWVHRIEIAT